MLVSELAARAQVPLATVKYYLRAGLLPPGDTTGPRRAEYDENHLHRLRLLRALREVGGAPVSALQSIVDAVADDSRPLHEVLCQISDALSPPLPGEEPAAHAWGLADAAIARLGWTRVRTDAAARVRLAALIQQVGEEPADDGLLTVDEEILGYYAEVADRLARSEIGFVDPSKDRTATLEDMVAGEAVFGEMLMLLRRLAHEHYHQDPPAEGDTGRE